MIEQAGLGPGTSVLEIGSSGANATLLAEAVDPDARVVRLLVTSTAKPQPLGGRAECR